MAQTNAIQSAMIRFDGVLYENLQFEPRPGWETQRVARRPESGNGEFVIELRDAQDELILEVLPSVDFESGCASSADDMRSLRITAYLPSHPQARFLVFRRKTFVIYRRKIAARPPEIRFQSVKPGPRGRGRQFRISWRAKHPQGEPLSYRFAYITASGRGFPVRPVSGNSKQEVIIDLGELPGGKGGRFGVLATDGVRSAVAVSPRFDVAELPPKVFISEPTGEQNHPAGQPLQFCGRAYDSAGVALPEKGLIWQLDGHVIGKDSCLALGLDLKSGMHKTTLSYAPQGKTIAQQVIGFSVAKPGSKQAAFDAFLPALEAAVKWDDVIHEMNEPIPGATGSSKCCCRCGDERIINRSKNGGCGCR